MISIISIEGNIAAGKSTFLQELMGRHACNPNVVFLDEPVELWESVKDKYGVSMLQKFYSNPKKYSFAFQMMAFISRQSMLKRKVEDLQAIIQTTNDHKVIITERSVHTDKCVFAQMLFDDGLMEDVEFQIYLKWFEELSIKQIDKVIMLQSAPEISYERIIKRGRPGEVIPLEYLEKCQEYHEKMLHSMDKVVFDADTDIYKNPLVLEEWIRQTNEIIQSYLYSN
jgi:deoxyadenosine/deoxycytidine kinase